MQQQQEEEEEAAAGEEAQPLVDSESGTPVYGGSSQGSEATGSGAGGEASGDSLERPVLGHGILVMRETGLKASAANLSGPWTWEGEGGAPLSEKLASLTAMYRAPSSRVSVPVPRQLPLVGAPRRTMAGAPRPRATLVTMPTARGRRPASTRLDSDTLFRGQGRGAGS